MFRVSDSLEYRRSELYRLVGEGLGGMAIVAAAADFERSLRRSMIMLAVKHPTAFIRETIEEQYRTISKYSKAWNKFVYPEVEIRLHEAVPGFENIKRSFDARNKLVHGKHGAVTEAYAAKHIAVIEGGTTSITRFSADHGADLMSRLKTRPRPRNASSNLK